MNLQVWRNLLWVHAMYCESCIVHLGIVLGCCECVLCSCSFLDFLSLSSCFDLNVKCCYGCEGFTHPLGREEKSRVKGLVGLEI